MSALRGNAFGSFHCEGSMTPREPNVVITAIAGLAAKRTHTRNVEELLTLLECIARLSAPWAGNVDVL